jgi:rubrerythrin
MKRRKHFIKKKENFICQVCGTKVIGTGYTNHCPNCLYSLHIDENVPGDRASECGGLMKPIGIEMKHGKYIIFHECRKCGKVMKNKVSEEDNFDKIIDISSMKS